MILSGQQLPQTRLFMSLALMLFSACTPLPQKSNFGLGGALGEAGPVPSSRGQRIAAVLERLPDPPRILFSVDTQEPNGEVQRLLNQGRDHFARGLKVEALERFAAVIEREPKVLEGWIELARSLRYLKRSQEALELLEDLPPARSQQALIARQFAGALEALGRHAEASEQWRLVLDLEEEPFPPRETSKAWQRYWSNLYLSEQVAGGQVSTAEYGSLAQPLAGLLRGDPLRAQVFEGGGALNNGEFDPPQRIDTGGGSQAAETHLSLAASGEMVAAWNDLRQPGGVNAWSLGVALSLDHGATWDDFLLRPAGNTDEDFEGDPMTAYDPRTGNLWVGGISFFPTRSVFVARKRPGVAQLDPVVVLNQDKVFDKGFLAAGPLPGNPNSTRLYATYNLGMQTSNDLGSTWSPLVPLPLGVSQHPRIGPGGELYISYWDFEDGIWLIRSFDGGATLEPPIRVATRLDFWDAQDGSRFPGRFRVAPIAYLAVSPLDGSLAMVYFDTTSVEGGESNVDLYLTRSVDQGSTWSPPMVVNGDSDPFGDQFFPWLEIDAEGRYHLAFFDTRYNPQLDDQVDGLFDITYSTSTDDGATWNETRLTPSSFSSSTATWPGFEQFVGDFISLFPTDDGALVAYPATFDGDLDIYVQRVRNQSIFSDGFESGDTGAWSAVSPLDGTDSALK